MKQTITTTFLLLFSVFLYSQEQQFQVFFDFDISETNTASTDKLQQWIQNNPTAVVEKVYGYCDSVGSLEYNDVLSLKRANYVLEKLKGNNINISDKAEVKGYGERFSQTGIASANRKTVVYYTIPIKKEEQVVKESLTDQAKNLKTGDKLTLKNLNFYNRSGVIVPSSEPILKELLSIMVERPDLKIEIQGHICCQLGTDLENIATIRARAIYNYLLENGISKNRLQYKGFGSSRPIHKIPEKNEQERDENRRVEIVILESE